MAAVKTRALVLSEKPYKERDRLVTLFTEEEGKVTAIVKGARNPRSQLASATRLFAWSEFVYWPGKTFAKVQEASLIDSFYAIGEDLNTMMLASYPLELVRSFYDENQKDSALLKVLVFFLYYLAHEEQADKEMLTLAFQLKLADAAGIRPDLTPPEGGSGYFIVDEGRVDAHRSAESYSYRMTPEMIALSRKLLFTPISKLRTETADPETVRSLMKLFNHFLQDQAGRKFKSFEMYQSVLGQGGVENHAGLQDGSHDDPSGRSAEVD